jgi:hypothetical protein
LIRNKRTIRKPIPGEENFNQVTKNLLKKFDTGKATTREVMILDNLIKRQGGKGLLERSFFADPTGKIRPSRLGIIQQEQGGNILDYFRQGITFRKPKPQILFFDRIKVEKFPKDFKSIVYKIRRGKALNQIELQKLLNFQLKQSGKFKPLGFISGESEISLAPGEIIVRRRKAAISIINGKKVPIIQADILKPTGRIKELLEKLDRGLVTKREGKELAYRLKRTTGLNYSYSQLRKDTARYFSLKKAGLSSVAYASKNLKYPKAVSPAYYPGRYPRSPISPVSPRSPKKYYPGRYPGSPVSPKSPFSPGKRIPGVAYPPKSPPRAPPKAPPVIIRSFASSKGSKKGAKQKEKYFDVFGKPIKKGNRYIKVNKSPLTLSQARDLRNYITDTSLSRRAQVLPSRNKPGRITINFPKGYAAKTGFKFRDYRIVKGKRIPLPRETLIELSKHLLDTTQEKQRISLARRIKQLQRSSKIPNRKVNIKERMRYIRSFKR